MVGEQHDNLLDPHLGLIHDQVVHNPVVLYTFAKALVDRHLSMGLKEESVGPLLADLVIHVLGQSHVYLLKPLYQHIQSLSDPSLEVRLKDDLHGVDPLPYHLEALQLSHSLCVRHHTLLGPLMELHCFDVGELLSGKTLLHKA